jgi:hypothetical protein
MKDQQHQDTLERQETANREVIAALGQLSRDVQAPPDFLERVLARADQQSLRRPPRAGWLGRLPWGVDVAVAAVLVLAVVGAVPQYLTWFQTYVRGIPAETVLSPEDVRHLSQGQARLVAEEETLPPTRGLGRERVIPSLPLGTWEVNASGDRGSLQLVSVSHQGELRGTLFGKDLVGFWDERSQKATFARLLNPADPSTVQLYTGYLFRTPGGLHGVGTATYTLTGSFTALAGTGATAARAVYGWYAQQAVTE